MITEATTSVNVRVDLKTHRVIAVSDESLTSRPEQPVFVVASNSARLDYYIVEKNTSAQYGIVVRPATTQERTDIDARNAAQAAITLQRMKEQKAIAIKDFYCGMLMRRFMRGKFQAIEEINCAVSYSGDDAYMLGTVKPLAITMQNAGNEWRHVVCQPIIDAMLASEGVGPELDDAYRNQVEAELDTFLTDRGFDIATYHR